MSRWKLFLTHKNYHTLNNDDDLKSTAGRNRKTITSPLPGRSLDLDLCWYYQQCNGYNLEFHHHGTVILCITTFSLSILSYYLSRQFQSSDDGEHSPRNSLSSGRIQKGRQWRLSQGESSCLAASSNLLYIPGQQPICGGALILCLSARLLCIIV